MTEVTGLASIPLSLSLSLSLSHSPSRQGGGEDFLKGGGKRERAREKERGETLSKDRERERERERDAADAARTQYGGHLFLAIQYCNVGSGGQHCLAIWDFDLEAFSRAPTDGGLAILAGQLDTFAK